MGKYWSLRQSLSFLLLFLPALAFYALQNKSLRVDNTSLLKAPAHFIQEHYDFFTNRLAGTVKTYFDLIDVKESNKVLSAEIGQVKTQLLRMKEVELENKRLATLLEFKNEIGRKTLAARVISKDVLIDNKSILIDKGADDGVERLQAVVSPEGAVGYIISVDSESSRVLLLTDRSANIDATVQRTRARGILAGVSTAKVRLKYIMRKQDVAEGDVIVTSGRQGYFPSGYIIGTVLAVEPSTAGVSFQADVLPAAAVDKLEEVLVLTTSSPSSESEGEPTS